jgi:acyl-CoA dehydrogenase
MINLELAKKHQETFGQVMMLAEHMMRPYSRKYDKEEHTYPKEMEEVAKLIGGARSAATGGSREPIPPGTVVNGGNMGAVVGCSACAGVMWDCSSACPAAASATRRSPRWAPRSR